MVDMSSMRPATMEEDHAMLLGAMKYIDDVCRKEGITYYAAYGTLLGAVREHGFIAWDYDADLWMKRADYERFIEAVKKHPNPKYFLQNMDSDKYFSSPSLMCVLVNGTLVWWGKHSEIAKAHTGFHVDIFPLDYGFGSEAENAKKWETIFFMRKNIFGRRAVLFMRIRTMRQIAKLMLKALLKIVPMKIWLGIYKLILRNKQPDESVLISTGGIYGPKRDIYPAELFEKTIDLPFGDMMIQCPAGYDALLTQIYGDYMTPDKSRAFNVKFFVKA